MTKVPFCDLAWQWNRIKDKVQPEMLQLFENSQYCLGNFVDRFEKSFSDYLKIDYSIGVNSGTSALHLALIAAGIEKDDKVLVPASTFVATIWAVLYIGAKPILCDVDSDSFTISVEDMKAKMCEGVKAIIPVHLYGQPANMNLIMEFAKENNLKVIEDAAQAHGAIYNGKKVGTIGDIGCFSFYPGKNLGSAGEAGMVVTNSLDTANRLKSLRSHGQVKRYCHDEIGYNYRMEGIQGLVLYHKLAHLDDWNNQRKKIANIYNKELANLSLTLPKVLNGDHVYHLYVVLSSERDKLKKYLEDNGIQAGLHYPIPINRQPFISRCKIECDVNSYPVSDKIANECLSLPIFPGMKEEQAYHVVDVIKKYYKVY